MRRLQAAPLRAAALAALFSLAAAAWNRKAWTLPPGFEIEPYTRAGVASARSLALSGNSQLNGPVVTYVSAMSFGGVPQSIKALVDLTGRGEADYVQVIVEKLSAMPNGIAWNGGSLFIASLDPYKSCTIYRLDNVDDYALNKRTAALSDLVVVRDDLPIDFWHGWKFIRFGPDGALYVPIGANCNACRLDGTPCNNGTVDGKSIYNYANSGNVSHVSAPYCKTLDSPSWEFGSIYRMARDGSNIAQVARGVRNTVGFDWHPGTKKLYFTDNGRDNWDLTDPNVTDNRPDCELNVLDGSEGQFFGFPFCHTGPTGGDINARPYLRAPGVGPQLVDPDLNANEAVMKCNGDGLQFRAAIQAMGPHTAPLGMRFYRWSEGANFPAEYNNSILLAQHGSWNRQRPIGARVMRAVLDPADPSKVTSFTAFLAGGVPGDKGEVTGPVPQVQPDAAYNGRPVDVEQLPDGSLLVSDDVPGGGTVYRVSYREPIACRGGGTSAAPLRRLSRRLLGNEVEDESDDDENEEEDEDMELTMAPTAIPGTGGGCAVNLGAAAGGMRRFRRCVHAQVPAGSGRSVQLATSIATVNGKRVLRGALVIPRYACVNSADGWVGFGFPKEQGGGDMIGANVFITRPSPGAATGAFTSDFKLASASVAGFKPSEGFLATADGLKAYQAGQALVTTFELLLPSAFQVPVKSPPPPPKVKPPPPPPKVKPPPPPPKVKPPPPPPKIKPPPPPPKIKPPPPPPKIKPPPPSPRIKRHRRTEAGSRHLLADAPTTIRFLLAMGDVDAGGAMKRHWMTGKLSIAFAAADLDAEVSSGVPVINKGAGPAGLPPPPPPSVASPPPPPGTSSPPPPPATACTQGEACCLEGVRYDACLTNTAAGASFSQYYKLEGGTLRVAIKASTTGWAAWAFNPSNQGHMQGADAQFVRPCASGCATGVSTPAFTMPSFSLNTFSPASTYTVSRSGSGGGAVWAAFSLPWPGGASITANYGVGPYSGGAAAGADGMSAHGTVPPKACISNVGGLATVAAGAC